jgi:mannose-1-phosphate guanylyltransferase
VRDRLDGDGLGVDAAADVRGTVIGPALIERGVHVAQDARVGSLAVLGEDVSVAAGASVERSVVLRGSRIGEGATLRDCIIAAGVTIGARTMVAGGAVVGEGVTIGADNVIDHGARIFPTVALGDGAIRF